MSIGVAALVLIGPWVGYNLVRFEKPVLLSNGLGATLLGGSCDAAFYGIEHRLLGVLPGRERRRARSRRRPRRRSRGGRPIPTGTRRRAQARIFRRYFAGAPDESENDVTARHEALDYIQRAQGPVRRWWSRRGSAASGTCSGPWQNARFDGLVEGRGLAQARVALVAFYLYAAAAIVGLVALRRRRHPIWPYLVLAAVVTFTVAISFAVQRYRIPVDAVLPGARRGRDRRAAGAAPTDETALSSPSAPPSTT